MRIIPPPSLGPALALILFASAASAETLDIKEGLWESTTSVKIDGLQIPPALLQSLPEKQRVQIERLDGRPRVDRTCVTQADIAQGFARFDKESACTRETLAATPRRFEANVTCGGLFAGTGTARVEAPTAGQVHGAAALETVMGAMTATLDARWLSASCAPAQK